MSDLPPSSSPGSRYPVTVLLVDDQLMVGEAVRRRLSPETDIRFHFCQDPMKAVAAAVETRPTVILQDLVMPGKDGLDLVDEYRRTDELEAVPIIVLSTKEDPKVRAEAFARGGERLHRQGARPRGAGRPHPAPFQGLRGPA